MIPAENQGKVKEGAYHWRVYRSGSIFYQGQRTYDHLFNVIITDISTKKVNFLLLNVMDKNNKNLA